jgi:PAS domain S-box-containing protein
MPPLPDDLPIRILDGSPDAILICDRSGIVRYWNAAAERVFGFSTTEVLGASMNLIIPQRLRARHWAGWEAAIRTGITRYADGHLLAVPALHKDGRQISIEFSIQLVKHADGQIDCVVAVIRDVTERYVEHKALRTQLNALKAKNARSTGDEGSRALKRRDHYATESAGQGRQNQCSGDPHDREVI